jgi:hypothetical protein
MLAPGDKHPAYGTVKAVSFVDGERHYTFCNDRDMWAIVADSGLPDGRTKIVEMARQYTWQEFKDLAATGGGEGE